MVIPPWCGQQLEVMTEHRFGGTMWELITILSLCLALLFTLIFLIKPLSHFELIMFRINLFQPPSQIQLVLTSQSGWNTASEPMEGSCGRSVQGAPRYPRREETASQESRSLIMLMFVFRLITNPLLYMHLIKVHLVKDNYPSMICLYMKREIKWPPSFKGKH